MLNVKCCVCGKFMSDDDVLLGFSRQHGQKIEYAHADCVEKEEAE